MILESNVTFDLLVLTFLLLNLACDLFNVTFDLFSVTVTYFVCDPWPNILQEKHDNAPFDEEQNLTSTQQAQAQQQQEVQQQVVSSTEGLLQDQMMLVDQAGMWKSIVLILSS